MQKVNICPEGEGGEGKGQGGGGGEREGEGAPIISLSTGTPYSNILTPTIQLFILSKLFYVCKFTVSLDCAAALFLELRMLFYILCHSPLR